MTEHTYLEMSGVTLPVLKCSSIEDNTSLIDNICGMISQKVIWTSVSYLSMKNVLIEMYFKW